MLVFIVLICLFPFYLYLPHRGLYVGLLFFLIVTIIYNSSSKFI